MKWFGFSPLQTLTRREYGAWLLTTGTLLTGGCGTVLHPERRGQGAGPIDWKIVALDGLALLFFFVPGVIAFAVDFATGAIYLPQHTALSSAEVESPLVRIPLPPSDRNLAGVSRCLNDHGPYRLNLEQERYETRSLASLDEFWPAFRELHG